MNERKIYRFWLAVGLILVVEFAAITLWKRWYWFVPHSEVGELYTRYSGSEGLNVSYVRDFRVNDTLALDLTFFEATDTTGWQLLQHDLGIKALPPNFETTISQGNDIVFMHKYTTTLAYKESSDTSAHTNDVVVVSYLNRNVCVFHADTREQASAIRHRNYEYNIK